MSLYNALFGQNPLAPQLFAILGIFQNNCEQWPVGRIRDIYTNEDGTKIFIFTRNGESPIGLDNQQRDAIEQNFRENHPQFVRSFVDHFDPTFITYEFNTPSDFLEATKEIAELTETTPPMERFRQLIKDLEEDKDTPIVHQAKEFGEKLLKKLESGESGEIQHGDGGMIIERFDPESDIN